jgi:hypothetical protein
MRRILLLSIAAVMLAALAMVGAVHSRGDTVSASPAISDAPAVRDAAAGCEGPVVSEEQAHRAVWGLAEVEAKAEELRALGIRPFTVTSSEPEPGTSPGTDSAAYVIYFGEDHGTHTVHVATFLVDARTGQVTAR